MFVLTGPTATGKTQLSIEIALRYGGEVISADSMQVYRGMDIGTAKPSVEERRGVPHHLVDILDPDEPFSVADFQRAARECVYAIASRGRLPMLVGGTALYIRALIDDYYFPEAPADAQIRSQLRDIAQRSGTTALHRMLAEVDPESAGRIHPNDEKRLIRALEVYRVTGRPMSSFPRSTGFNPDLLVVGLDMPRDEMYRRIDARVDDMVERGLVQEVEGLIRKGYSDRLFPMRSLGYREIGDYLFGRTTLGESLRLFKRNTRHFARRQLTWFRNDSRINWVTAGNDRARESALEETSKLIEGKWSRP